MAGKAPDEGVKSDAAERHAGSARLTYEELSQLHERKNELKRQHTTYLEEHPEVSRVLADFMCAALLEKPDDVFAFAEQHFSSFEGRVEGHRPLVVSGPSGVGKGTLISMLLRDYPNAFGFCISHTTRKPRQGEVDGTDYHFVDREAFEAMIQQKAFLEYANVHGEWYGTSINSVKAVRGAGKVCVLDIDVNGVKKVKATDLAPRYVFIRPPSIQELENRLRDRSSETAENMDKRLEAATVEIEYGTRAGNFHKVLVNDDLDECVGNLQHTLLEWYPHLDGFVAGADE